MNSKRISNINESFKSITSKYEVWLSTLGFGSSVCYGYKFRVVDFFEWLQTQNILQINLINQNHIKQYFEYLQIRKNKRRSGTISITHLNHNFDAIDKLLEFLHQIGLQTAPLPTNFRIKNYKQDRIDNIKPLTREQIQLLQDNITNDKLYTATYYTYKTIERKQYTLQLLFALYYGCGLRRKEGYNLTADDIDFERKTVFIRQGKGYKDRIVPMSNGIYDTLEDYVYNFRNLQKLNHQRLFVLSHLQIAQSLRDLQNVCDDETLRYKHLTLHTLRHSIATHLLQNGMGIENIAKFLGHTSLESTQIYTHFI